jgi:hypothetical protein
VQLLKAGQLARLPAAGHWSQPQVLAGYLSRKVAKMALPKIATVHLPVAASQFGVCTPRRLLKYATDKYFGIRCWCRVQKISKKDLQDQQYKH